MREHFTPCFPRQIQIKDEKGWAFGLITGMDAVEQFNGLLSIGEDSEIIGDMVLQERFAHKDHVPAVIFYQKNGAGTQRLAICAFVKREQ